MSVYLIKMEFKGCPNTILRDLFDNMFYPDYDSQHYISNIISFYSYSNSLYFEEPMFWNHEND